MENKPSKEPGVCIGWDEVRAELGEIPGDEQIVREIWEQNDREAYLFLWQCVLSF